MSLNQLAVNAKRPITESTTWYLVSGTTHLGVYRVVSGEMSIDWDDVARPADLADASTYQTE